MKNVILHGCLGDKFLDNLIIEIVDWKGKNCLFSVEIFKKDTSAIRTFVSNSLVPIQASQTLTIKFNNIEDYNYFRLCNFDTQYYEDAAIRCAISC